MFPATNLPPTARHSLRKLPVVLAALPLLTAAASAQNVNDGPRNTTIKEVPWEQLSDTNPSGDGQKALAIDPKKWKHGETENFIIHFRRVTEANKVAREIEYDLWFIAKALGATKEQYSRKSHVYVFEDEEEWKKFLGMTNAPQWASSFAHGDSLYLNVRRSNNTGKFDSNTLAHETTHAVVARLYPRKRWPVWLNEGFAEYMGGATVAARKNQPTKSHQQQLRAAEFSLDELSSMKEYPTEDKAVHQLYQSSEKLVRYLMNEHPKEKFAAFIDATLNSKNLETAVMLVYGDQYKDFDAFRKKYAKFTK